MLYDNLNRLRARIAACLLAAGLLPAACDRSMDNNLLLSAPPNTMEELLERLLASLPETIKCVPGFNALTAEQQAACIHSATSGFTDRFEAALEELGGLSANPPDDLVPFSELLVELSAQAIRQHRPKTRRTSTRRIRAI